MIGKRVRIKSKQGGEITVQIEDKIIVSELVGAFMIPTTSYLVHNLCTCKISIIKPTEIVGISRAIYKSKEIVEVKYN